jgi:poly-gamma-glutamate synthesis protein (capsule biosynthesis protein)
MERAITLALAGDVMLGRGVDRSLAARGPAYPWGDLRPVLAATDAVAINLECALTSRREPWTDHGARKAFSFRTEPDQGIACLAAGRVACASLANNHAGDFGDAGLLETVAALDHAGIAHAGAGGDLAAAMRPALLEVAGVRLAVVAFADHPAAWAAAPANPGINYLPAARAETSLATVERAIAAACAVADVVVCSLHWGPNMRPRPPREFRAFAHHVIEAGADVLFGHSAHVVQGVEIYRGRPILYDTGDFIDDYVVDPDLRNDLSALFLLRIAPPVIERLALLPVHIDHCQVNRAHGRERAWFARRITALCAELGTAVDDEHEHLNIRLQ